MPGEQRAGISARVIADSVHERSRLTTFEATFPRFILAEFNTHRVLSRNSASSRAIPVWKKLHEVLSNPFVPLQFGKNKAGMQSAESIAEEDADAAKQDWLVGRDVAVIQAFFLAGGAEQIVRDSKEDPRARKLCSSVEELSYSYRDVIQKIRPLSLGIHKQHANRVLEPYAWHTVIVTGTFWRNFYALRASKMAQPEIQALAIAMLQAHNASTPRELEHGEWHLPFIFPEDIKEVGDDEMKLARISSARCARVSYLTHDGKRSLDADLSMADGLQKNGHTSPFEHPAMTHDTTGAYFGNFNGNFDDRWIQYRKTLENEHDFSELITSEDLLMGVKGDLKLVDFVLGLKA
jgi:thymidylate synthase ThyX